MRHWVFECYISKKIIKDYRQYIISNQCLYSYASGSHRLAAAFLRQVWPGKLRQRDADVPCGTYKLLFAPVDEGEFGWGVAVPEGDAARPTP